MSSRVGEPAPALPPELSPRGPGGRVRGGSTPVPGSRRGRRLPRFLAVVAVLTSATIVLGSGVGYGLLRYYDGEITRRDVFSGLVRADRPAAAPGNAVNYLIVGSDTREEDVDESFQGRGAARVTGQRSDALLLVHLSAGRDRATIVSFPRDSWVQIPACRQTDGSLREAHRNRINEALLVGGPTCTVATLEALTSLKIDHYLQVNFAGFQRMVDAIGGVDICTPVPLKDRDSGLDIPAGRSHLGGAMALSYVRARKIDNDLGRAERQQKFLAAMMAQATSSGVLLRPDRLLPFLNTVANSITTDEDLTTDDMRELAVKLRGLDPSKVTFLTVPVADDDYVTAGGARVVQLDEVAGRALFDAIRRDGSPIPAPGATPAAPPLTVAPSAIAVRVLNGTDRDGLARQAAADLREVGFRVAGAPTGADTTTYQQTVVRYGSSRTDSAATLAAAVPGALLQPVASSSNALELVVGSSYAGTRPVTVAPPALATPAAPSGSAAPGAPGAPAAGPRTAADDPCA